MYYNYYKCVAVKKEGRKLQKKSFKVNTIFVHCIMLHDLWIKKNEGNLFSSVSGQFLNGHTLKPYHGEKRGCLRPLLFWSTWSKFPPPLPRLSEIVPLVFISVNCLHYFLAHYLQVVHVPIFSFCINYFYKNVDNFER